MMHSRRPEAHHARSSRSIGLLAAAWTAVGLCLACAAPVPVEAEGASPAKLLPAETLFYVEGRGLGDVWRSIRKGDFYERLRSEGLLDPLRRQLNMSSNMQQANAQLAVDVLGRRFAFCYAGGVKIMLLQADPFLGNELFLFVGRMIVGGQQAYPVDSHTHRGVEIVHYGPADAQWCLYQGLLPDDWSFSVYSPSREDADAIVDRYFERADKTLAGRLASFELPTQDANLVVFADIATIRRSQPEKDVRDQTNEVARLFQTFGYDTADAATDFCAALTAAEGGFSVDAELTIDDERLSPFARSVLSGFNQDIFTAGLIPPAAGVGVALAVDTAAISAAVSNELAEAGQTNLVLENLANVFFEGSDILADIVPLLGPNLTFFIEPREGRVPSVALVIELSNPQVSDTLEGAAANLVDWLGRPQSDEGSEPRHRAGRTTIGGSEIYYVVLPQAPGNSTAESVFMGVVDGFGVVSVSDEGIKRAAAFAAEGERTHVEASLYVRADIARLLDVAAWFAAARGNHEESDADKLALAKAFFATFEPVRVSLNVRPSCIKGHAEIRYMRPKEPKQQDLSERRK